VLRSYRFPGVPTIRNEIIQYLFELCCFSPEGVALSNEEGRPVADSNALADLLFGIPTKPQDRKVDQ
jgi:hypothetical protein